MPIHKVTMTSFAWSVLPTPCCRTTNYKRR